VDASAVGHIGEQSPVRRFSSASSDDIIPLSSWRTSVNRRAKDALHAIVSMKPELLNAAYENYLSTPLH
jgi:hypothetical protein